jgi:hypothetical protein
VVLEDHGWTIHRIWSTDWFNRPDAQLRETIAAIEAARNRANAESPQPANIEPSLPITRNSTPTPTSEMPEPASSVPYSEVSFAVSPRHDIHQVSVEYLADIVRRIIEAEGPIHEDEIVIRVRMLWGQRRAGGRIQHAVREALRAVARVPGIAHEGPFYLSIGAQVKVRDRSQATSPSLRRPEMLPSMELRAALVAVVDQNLGADREEAITSVSRAVGFRATSAQLRTIIEEQIQFLLDAGELLETEGRLSRWLTGCYSSTNLSLAARRRLQHVGRLDRRSVHRAQCPRDKAQAYSGKSRHGGGGGAESGRRPRRKVSPRVPSSAHVSDTARAPEA